MTSKHFQIIYIYIRSDRKLISAARKQARRLSENLHLQPPPLLFALIGRRRRGSWASNGDEGDREEEREEIKSFPRIMCLDDFIRRRLKSVPYEICTEATACVMLRLMQIRDLHTNTAVRGSGSVKRRHRVS